MKGGIFPMKKVIAGLMMSATILGLATFATNAVSVHAADTTPAVGSKIGATTEGTIATENKANLTVQAGDLSFTQPQNVDLGKTDVTSVFASGFHGDSVDGGSTTVSDFLGDNGTWKLNVSASGFGNPALDGDGVSALSLTTTSKDGTSNTMTLGKSQAEAISGGAGETTTNLSYKLDINSGVLLNKGTFANTVTWNLANTPGANIDGDVTPANAE